MAKMNFLLNIFGLKKLKKQSDENTLRKLEIAEESLLVKQDFLEKQILEEKNTIKKHVNTNKRVALQALKRKRIFEEQLKQIDGPLLAITHQKEALEIARLNQTVLKTVKKASSTLKLIKKDINVEEVFKTIDDLANMNDITKDISDAILENETFRYDADKVRETLLKKSTA